MSAEAAGPRRFEAGWQVIADRGRGWLEVRRGAAEVVVGPGRYLRLDRPAVPPRPGDDVMVAAPATSPGPEAPTW